MTHGKPIPETLFELQCIQQWGEKFGWAAVEGLVKARIEIYEKVGKKTTIGTLRG